MVKQQINISLKELIQMGAHLGHRKKYYNSTMGSYLVGHRAGVDIINLEKTLVSLRQVSKIFEQLVIRNGKLVFINTIPMFNDVLDVFSKISGQSVINGRWVSGGFTNFDIVKRHFKHRNRSFIEVCPDFVFLVGLKKNMRVLKEATRVGIPSVALVDSDSNIKNVTYPIPSNDDSFVVLYFFLMYFGYCLRYFSKKFPGQSRIVKKEQIKQKRYLKI